MKANFTPSERHRSKLYNVVSLQVSTLAYVLSNAKNYTNWFSVIKSTLHSWINPT